MMKKPIESWSVRFATILLASGATLLSQSLHAQGVHFSDDFEGDTSALWNVFDGSTSGTSDFSAIFNYDYGALGIPSAPNSASGTTKGVRLEVNNLDQIAENAAVNLFPAGVSITGNFALRFDMWINYNGGAYGGTGSTEFAIQGLNHAGDKVNWPFSVDSDGFFYAVTGEGGAARDYRFYAGQFFNSPLELTFFDGGFLDRDANGIAENEIFANNPASYPLNYIFPSPPFETLAAPGKQWVQGELRLINGRITWLLNGFVIAELDNPTFWTEGTPMIGYMDIFPSRAAPAADNFVLYDNIRIVDLDVVDSLPQIGVEATDALAAEPDNPGEFTIQRTGDTTDSLEVLFSLRGTATPGEDYDISAFTKVANNLYSVVIPAGASSIALPIPVIDDSLGEITETIILVLSGDPDAYEVSGNMIATILLEDDGDQAAINITAVKSGMYERDPEDAALVRITRQGSDETTLTITLSYGGTAAAADYVGAQTSIVLFTGESVFEFPISAVDNSLVDGDRTIIISIIAGEGYGPGEFGSTTLTIRDDERTPAPVLFSDSFATDTASDWSIQFNAANGLDDYTAIFSHDYASDFISPSPLSVDGSTRGLKLTVNKNDDTGSAAALNVFPNDQTFSGNYALRFEMYLTFDSFLPGTTEHSLFGINHSGTVPLRHNLAGGDGVWFAVETDGSASGGRSYASYFSTDPLAAPPFLARAASTLTHFFAVPPFKAAGAASGRWVDVEVNQFAGQVTLLINGVEIFSRNDTSASNSGNIMLGFMDAFNSIGAAGNFVIFDNVRVVDLGESGGPAGQATLGTPSFSGMNIIIPFTAESGSAEDFTLLGATDPTAEFTPVTGAVVTEISAGMFSVEAPLGDSPGFYMIRTQ